MPRRTGKTTTTTTAASNTNNVNVLKQQIQQIEQPDQEDEVELLHNRFETIMKKAMNKMDTDDDEKENMLTNLLNTLNGGLNNVGGNQDLKKRLKDTQDKLSQLKKMRVTDAEGLFEDFKIAAEKRDADSKKYINQLKFQVQVLQGKNKLLNETFQQKYHCDYEDLETKLAKEKENEANFKIDQVKEVWGEKVKEQDKIIEQLRAEKEAALEKCRGLEETIVNRDAMVEEAKKQYQHLYDQFEQFRASTEETSNTNSNEAQKRLREAMDIVAQFKADNEKLSLALQESLRQNAEQEKSFTELKQKMVEDWLQSEKSKALEFDRRLGEMKVIYEKHSTGILDECRKKFLDEENDLKQRFKKEREELIDQNNNEIADVEKKLGDTIDELEEKLLTQTSESLQQQKSLVSEIHLLKSKLEDALVLKSTNQNYLDIFQSLTFIKLSQLKENKYEISLQHPRETNRKILGELLFKDQEEISFTPISFENCARVSESIESYIDFHPHQSIGFVVKLLESISD